MFCTGDTLGNPRLKSSASVPAWWEGRCYLPSLLSHLFCKKAEKLLIKHAFYLRSHVDRALEIRDHVNGTCKEMKLSIYHLSGLSQLKQQLFKP